MEIFGARPRTALEASLDEVAKSDLFVGIYAHRYGSMPDGFVSITEREYDRAVELKKPVLAFIVDDTFHWDEALKENDPGRSRLATLKARIRNEQTPGFCPQAVGARCDPGDVHVSGDSWLQGRDVGGKGTAGHRSQAHPGACARCSGEPREYRTVAHDVVFSERHHRAGPTACGITASTSL